MPKRKWNDVVDRAIQAYRSGDYVYLYGAKNVRLTSEAQIREYFRMEPAYYSRYSEEEKRQIIKNSLYHVATDCSGFVAHCTGDAQWSWGQINNCYKYNSLAAGPPASILFTTFGNTGRHVGIDAANGMALHIGAESTDANIRTGKAGIIFETIDSRPWERSGQSNVIDYTGAFSPYPPTTQLIDDVYHPKQHPTGVVNTDLYLRTGPGIVNAAILVMPTGSAVTIYDEAKAADGGTWAFVEFRGTLGWCNKSFLTIS